MPSAKLAESPRLLFVVSGDFGELFNARFFFAGTGSSSSFVLPLFLAQLNRERLPGRTHQLAGIGSIRRAIAIERPDVVFFFSGFLLALSGALSIDELRRLVDELAEDGVALATSDPFLGLFRELSRPCLGGQLLAGPIWWAARTLLGPRVGTFADLVQCAEVLAQVPTISILAEVGPSHGAPPALVLARPAPPALGVLPAGLEAGRPFWLFVLSSQDAKRQIEALGRRRFVARLQRRLEDSAAAGRTGVFVGPAAIVAALEQPGRRPDDCLLLAVCAVEDFLALTTAAENAFYWNTVSASLLARLPAGRPVFFFDAGHLAAFDAKLGARASELYYGGIEPPRLDLARPLDPAELAGREREFASALAPIAARQRQRGLDAHGVVERLLAVPGVMP